MKSGFRSVFLSMFAGVVCLQVSAVFAQDPRRELELGTGLFLNNPLRVADLGGGHPSGVTADVVWTQWFSDRVGLAPGLTFTPAGFVDDDTDSPSSLTSFYGHATWRWRWAHHGGRNSVQFGLGGGWVQTRLTYARRVWDPDTGTVVPDGSTAREVSSSPLWHAEVFFTHRDVLRDLDVRYGFRTTPLLHIPLTFQPVLTVVWAF